MAVLSLEPSSPTWGGWPLIVFIGRMLSNGFPPQGSKLCKGPGSPPRALECLPDFFDSRVPVPVGVGQTLPGRPVAG